MAAKIRTKGRAFVALDVSILGDTKLILCGQNARTLLPLLMAHSAQQGTDGRVPSNPREVQLFAHFDRGERAVGAALTALVGAGYLVEGDDRDWLLLNDWARVQPDFGGSETRPATASASALLRWHREGKHNVNVNAECGFCNGTVRAEQVSVAPEVEVDPAAHLGAGSSASSPTMEAFLTQWRAAMDDEIPAASSPGAGYLLALESADECAAALPGLLDAQRGLLHDEVLAHALTYFLGLELDETLISSAGRAAKALGPDGHRWWIQAIANSAHVEFDDTRHAVRYLTKVAKSSKAEGGRATR